MAVVAAIVRARNKLGRILIVVLSQACSEEKPTFALGTEVFQCSL